MSTNASPAANVARRSASPALAALACVTFLSARPMVAQAPSAGSSDSSAERRLQFAIGGGFAKTSATPLNSTSLGYQLQAGLDWRTPVRPLALRADGIFSEAGATRIQALTASVVLATPAAWTARPYLMGGGGGYAELGKGMAAGWNLGVGVSTRTGRQTLFLESRVHAYRDALNGQPYLVPFGVVNLRHEKYTYFWQPLTFGFRF